MLLLCFMWDKYKVHSHRITPDERRRKGTRAIRWSFCRGVKSHGTFDLSPQARKIFTMRSCPASGIRGERVLRRTVARVLSRSWSRKTIRFSS